MTKMEDFNNKISTLILILALFVENTTTADDLQADVNLLRTHLTNFVKLRSQVKLPYIKFRIALKRVVTCGLSRSQKLALCYNILRGNHFRYHFSRNTYPYLRCQRIPLPTGKGLQIPVFKCPTPHRLLGPEMQTAIHLPISYYMSGALLPVKTIIYFRYVGTRVGLIPYLLFSGTTKPSFETITRHERNRSYITSSSLISLMHHDVPPYFIEEWTANVIRDPSYAETQVTYFNQHVIKNNRIYSRFQITFKNINICGLGKHGTRTICSHAFDSNEYNYDVDTTKNISMRCRKAPINFVYNDLRQVVTNILYCGDAIINDNKVKSFILTSSIQKNSVLTYGRYHPHKEFLPEAIIFDIQLEGLRDPFKISKELMDILRSNKKRKLKGSNVEGPANKKQKSISMKEQVQVDRFS